MTRTLGLFLSVFGFNETSYIDTQRKLIKNAIFTPINNGYYFEEHCEFKFDNEQSVSCGSFSMPSVANLHERISNILDDRPICNKQGIIKVNNMIGEARSLHLSDTMPDCSVIQAASQFNFLEMSSPLGVPEDGIGIYEYDKTQGPACALSCIAGTAYRNYLVPISRFEDKEDIISHRGQVKSNQLNGLYLVEQYLQAKLGMVPWRVKNGYIESSIEKLKALNDLIANDQNARDEILKRVCIGVQSDTQVTSSIVKIDKSVTQTYNSAISIGYSLVPTKFWEPLATIILDATYEATCLVAVLNSLVLQEKQKSTHKPLFLTKVGGGVFENKDEWIQSSMKRSFNKAAVYGVDLNVSIVHFKIPFPKGYNELAT